MHTLIPLREAGDSYNSSASDDSLQDVGSPIKDEQTLHGVNVLHDIQPSEASGLRRANSITRPVLALMSCALLPALMGTFFYMSIGFNAENGEYMKNGTFVRPVDEGLTIGAKESVIFAHVSPLLVSSITSSVVGLISPVMMSLLAYHLAHRWLLISRDIPGKLPTPIQYHFTMNLVNSASPMALVRFFYYYSKQLLFGRRIPYFRTPSSRTVVSPVLSIAVLGAIVVFFFDWSIKIVDVILHEQIRSSIQVVNSSGIPIAGNAVLAPECDFSGDINDCKVMDRALNASLGGNNKSSSFRVYEAEDRSRGSLAYIGPVEPSANHSFVAKTIAAGTTCQVLHPSCIMKNDKHMRCASGTKPEEDLLAWNKLVYNNGFNVTSWEFRLQSFTTIQGNVSNANGSGFGVGTNGARVNPIPIATFGCFNDYSSIPYNNTNMSFRTPFYGWWSSAGIKNKPDILCSITLCNTTVYDAHYSLSKGSTSLINGTLVKANQDTALAISGATVYLGTDSDIYRYDSRFLDDQLQLDLMSAGNINGSDPDQFGAAWAQALSNRLLGWSVGAVNLEMVNNATTGDERLAWFIPLLPTHLFAVLNFAYAACIIGLGISCLLLSVGNAREKALRRGSYTPVQVGDFETQSRKLIDSELSQAQNRLTERSTLVHGLVDEWMKKEWTEKTQSGVVVGRQGDEGLRFRGDSAFGHNHSELHEEVRLGLVSQTDGAVGLSFSRL